MAQHKPIRLAEASYNCQFGTDGKSPGIKYQRKDTIDLRYHALFTYQVQIHEFRVHAKD